MNLLQLKKRLRIFTDLKFAIVILLTIAIASSLGSFIEQDENIEFYQENYPLNKPIYGFITWKSYGQLDPLVEYNLQAEESFKIVLEQIKENMLYYNLVRKKPKSSIFNTFVN